MTTVNILDLASAAVACTVSASQCIRKIAEEKNTRLKQDGSFVTDADFVAQGVIVNAIQSVSQDVRIVGEESPEEMARHSDADSTTAEQHDDILQRTKDELRVLYHHHRDSSFALPERLPLAQGPPTDSTFDIPEDPADCQVEASRLTVIVDPLDGTKSYAHEEYDAVSILIGIVLDNEPVFGVIGKPFGYTGLSNILDTECATVYGGSLIKSVCTAGGRQLEPPLTKEQPRAVISKSRSEGIVEDFCVFLGTKGLIDSEPMMVAGAGEKSLRLILQHSNEGLWFFPRPGTSRWDVAAPDAMLRALNGRLTDKHGNDLDYSKRREDAENVDGIVASSSQKLHAECIRLFNDGDWNNR